MQTEKSEREKTDYDVIIIGGGAAGISAALWCDELQLKTLLLETGAELGGQLLRVYNPIKNHLGIETENGREMRDVFVRQIENCRFYVRLQSEIVRVNVKSKTVTCGNGEIIRAQTIIVATGVRRRKLNVEGEAEFTGKGIIESGKRDADSLRNKKICIVGGGDAAFENALILSETASRVTLVHRGESFRARSEFIEQVIKNPKVEILTETVARKLVGDECVRAVELENLQTGRIFKRNAEAILIRVGVEPNTDFLREQLDLNDQGYIKVNQNCETSIESVYAIGDAANPVAPTISSAVGMGATAAKAIFAQLNFEF
jgi:thioredoxin reductase (NADPH)